jgi:hypothetical protein
MKKLSDDDEHRLDHVHETMEINGGDDVDKYFPTEPQPSRQDVLQGLKRLLLSVNT